MDTESGLDDLANAMDDRDNRRKSQGNPTKEYDMMIIYT